MLSTPTPSIARRLFHGRLCYPSTRLIEIESTILNFYLPGKMLFDSVRNKIHVWERHSGYWACRCTNTIKCWDIWLTSIWVQDRHLIILQCLPITHFEWDKSYNYMKRSLNIPVQLSLQYLKRTCHCQYKIMLIRYNDIIMGAMTSQITSLAIVYSTVYSGADQRKDQSPASLVFVRGIHRWPVNSPHKWPVTRKKSPFDDVIMLEFNDNVGHGSWWRIYGSANLIAIASDYARACSVPRKYINQ